MATLRGGQQFQKRMAEITSMVSKPATLRVGFLSGATYPDGTSVGLVAFINEFGAPSRGQPPRPAFRNMIAKKQKEWAPAIAGLLKANDYDAERVLDITGDVIAGQLRESISSITTPPLAPATIKRKGSSKPWIESGHLLASVSHEIVT